MSRQNVLITALIMAICILLLFYIPKLQLLDEHIPDTVSRIDLENKARATLAQIIAGVFVLVGLYLGWRRIKVSEQGQITERFTRAIDQLGATNEKGEPRLEIRLGGIYGLGRIARDSAEGRDYYQYWQVIEVLTAYIRSNAPLPPDETEDENPIPSTFQDPPLDIQTILTIIARRPLSYGKGEVECLDLRKSNLSGAYLKDANLEGADLVLTRLDGANLRGACLRGARLYMADMRTADLEGADLEGADLHGARLEFTYLGRTNLVRTDLRMANLEGDSLEGANLRGADLKEVNLKGVNLKAAEGLTLAQLSAVNTLFGVTGLDTEIEARIRKEHPHLFEEEDKELAKGQD